MKFIGRPRLLHDCYRVAFEICEQIFRVAARPEIDADVVQACFDIIRCQPYSDEVHDRIHKNQNLDKVKYELSLSTKIRVCALHDVIDLSEQTEEELVKKAANIAVSGILRGLRTMLDTMDGECVRFLKTDSPLYKISEKNPMFSAYLEAVIETTAKQQLINPEAISRAALQSMKLEAK